MKMGRWKDLKMGVEVMLSELMKAAAELTPPRWEGETCELVVAGDPTLINRSTVASTLRRVWLVARVTEGATLRWCYEGRVALAMRGYQHDLLEFEKRRNAALRAEIEELRRMGRRYE